MTILVDASLECNFNCAYCYNDPIRRNSPRMDLELVKKAVKRAVSLGLGSWVVLHGGEPLYWGKEVVEELFKTIVESGGRCGVQTNGSLIDEEYVGMFKEYKVLVGVSIDGPHPLNSLRCDERMTEKVMRNIRMLKDEGVETAIISVVHKANGLRRQRKAFKEFILNMSSMGIQGRINPCLHPDPRIQLTVKEAKEFYLDMADFMMENGLHGYTPFYDICNSLQGKVNEVVCTFRGCDPYTTMGGIVITPHGKLSVCHKFATRYVERSDEVSNTRFIILSATDCAGCRYLYNCKGGCPANAIGFDWRNKDRWCEVWRSLFEYFEKRLTAIGITPCLHPPDVKGGEHEDHWVHVRT